MEKRTIVLKIKLGRPKEVRLKTMLAMLARIGAECDRARNKMIRAWELDKLDGHWQPEQRENAKGPMTYRDGSPILKKACGPNKGDVTHSTWLYHQGRASARQVSSNLVSMCAQQVIQYLQGKRPYDGKPGWVWQAILDFEQQPPTYRSRAIPVPNNSSSFTYGDDQCWLTVPLLSKADTSGLPKRLSIALRTSRLKYGQMEWLRRADEGLAKLSDSELVYRKEQWYWYCVIMTDPDKLRFDPERVLTLRSSLNRSSDIHDTEIGRLRSPFVVTLPDGRSFGIGYGLPLKMECERLAIRRKVIQRSSRNHISAGRGKQRFFAKSLPITRRTRQLKDHFCKELAHRLMMICEEHNCGTMLYREPSRFLRKFAWFERQGVSLDWTNLLVRLKSTCLKDGIAMKTEMLKYEEWKQDTTGAQDESVA